MVVKSRDGHVPKTSPTHARAPQGRTGSVRRSKCTTKESDRVSRRAAYASLTRPTVCARSIKICVSGTANASNLELINFDVWALNRPGAAGKTGSNQLRLLDVQRIGSSCIPARDLRVALRQLPSPPQRPAGLTSRRFSFLEPAYPMLEIVTGNHSPCRIEFAPPAMQAADAAPHATELQYVTLIQMPCRVSPIHFAGSQSMSGLAHPS